MFLTTLSCLFGQSHPLSQKQLKVYPLTFHRLKYPLSLEQFKTTTKPRTIRQSLSSKMLMQSLLLKEVFVQLTFIGTATGFPLVLLGRTTNHGSAYRFTSTPNTEFEEPLPTSEP